MLLPVQALSNLHLLSQGQRALQGGFSGEDPLPPLPVCTCLIQVQTTRMSHHTNTGYLLSDDSQLVLSLTLRAAAFEA